MWPKKPSRSSSSTTSVLPFVLDMNEALTPEAPKIWPEGNLSPNNRNEVQPISARRGDVAAALDDLRPRVRGPLHDRLRPQRADGAAGLPGALGRRQAHRLHADRRHRQLPPRHGARPRHPGRQGPRRRRVHGRQLRQQEPEPGRRPDHRDAGQGDRRAGEAGVLTQGGLHRRPRPLADDAELHGRHRRRRHADGDPAARRERHGALPEELRDDGRHRALQVRRTPTCRSAPRTRIARCRPTSAVPSIRRGSSASSR